MAVRLTREVLFRSSGMSKFYEMDYESDLPLLPTINQVGIGSMARALDTGKEFILGPTGWHIPGSGGPGPGGPIDPADLISGDTPNALETGTDGLLLVPPSAGGGLPPVATFPNNILTVFPDPVLGTDALAVNPLHAISSQTPNALVMGGDGKLRVPPSSGGGASDAIDVAYDNSVSKLDADNVQDAIDELDIAIWDQAMVDVDITPQTYEMGSPRHDTWHIVIRGPVTGDVTIEFADAPFGGNLMMTFHIDGSHVYCDYGGGDVVDLANGSSIFHEVYFPITRFSGTEDNLDLNAAGKVKWYVRSYENLQAPTNLESHMLFNTRILKETIGSIGQIEGGYSNFALAINDALIRIGQQREVFDSTDEAPDEEVGKLNDIWINNAGVWTRKMIAPDPSGFNVTIPDNTDVADVLNGFWQDMDVNPWGTAQSGGTMGDTHWYLHESGDYVMTWSNWPSGGPTTNYRWINDVASPRNDDGFTLAYASEPSEPSSNTIPPTMWNTNHQGLFLNPFTMSATHKAGTPAHLEWVLVVDAAGGGTTIDPNDFVRVEQASPPFPPGAPGSFGTLAGFLAARINSQRSGIANFTNAGVLSDVPEGLPSSGGSITVTYLGASSSSASTIFLTDLTSGKIYHRVLNGVTWVGDWVELGGGLSPDDVFLRKHRPAIIGSNLASQYGTLYNFVQQHGGTWVLAANLGTSVISDGIPNIPSGYVMLQIIPYGNTGQNKYCIATHLNTGQVYINTAGASAWAKTNWISNAVHFVSDQVNLSGTTILNYINNNSLQSFNARLGNMIGAGDGPSGLNSAMLQVIGTDTSPIRVVFATAQAVDVGESNPRMYRRVIDENGAWIGDWVLIAAPLDLSTNEQDTGRKDLDGRTIYVRTFIGATTQDANSLGNPTATFFPAGVIQNILSISGWWDMGGGIKVAVLTRWYPDNVFSFIFFTTGGPVQFHSQSSGNRTDAPYQITLEYTKV